MTTYSYTGTLTDIGVNVLTPRFPVMRVRPEAEAYGPDGLVSDVPVEVDLDPVTGEFAMTLIPSVDLTPARGGRDAVRYVIEVGRFEDTVDGTVFHGIDVWVFTALAGGGPIVDMVSAPASVWYLGQPWPTVRRPGFYWDIYNDDIWRVD